MTFATDAFFEFDKAVLKPEAKAKLEALVEKTRNINLEAVIAVGHTDTTGSSGYNQILSMRRAEAVKSYLVSLGVEPNLVYAEGKGIGQAVADNATRETRAKSRRVEIEVIGTRITGGAESPLPAPGAPAAVVYNANLAPQLPRHPTHPDQPVIQVGLPATLSFDIGPKAVMSVLPATPAAEAITRSTVDVRLTVVLACSFCEPRAESLKRIVFRPSEGRSDKARFEFTPQRQPVRWATRESCTSRSSTTRPDVNTIESFCQWR